jgi:hypothetical protein
MAGRPRDEAEAYRRLEAARWGPGPVRCPHCATAGRCYLLRPADGTARRTRSGTPTARRVWKCGACRRQFSVLVGTVLEGTRVSLWTWIAIIEAWGAGERPTTRDVAREHRLSLSAARALVDRTAAAVAGVVASAPPASERPDVLARVLSLGPDAARRVTDATPRRRVVPRPDPQCGPTADYGTA